MSAPTWDDFAELALKRITSIRDNDDVAFIQGKQGLGLVRSSPDRPAPIVTGIASPTVQEE